MKQSLAEAAPEIAKEWHPTKNGSLTPNDVSRASEKKAWWLCSKGHEWEANISSRTKVNGTGCPYCSGRNVIEGVNDLKTWCIQNNKEELLREWNYEKNGELTPATISKSNSKKVWWKCEKFGHEWEASIANRVKNRNCPYCGNRKVLAGFNDLQTIFPDIAQEWDVGLNEGLLPSEVAKSSGKEYWWKCNEGHTWQESVDARTRILRTGKHAGCPYCSGKRVKIKYNDLATERPDIAAEWHPTLNGEAKPTDYTRGSTIKVWWLCKKGHSYQSTIANRTAKNGTNCPYCSNQKILKGYNDLLSCYPEIAAEWDFERNGELRPDGIASGSEKKVFWICDKGHRWETKVSHRTRLGSGCPVCSGSTSFQEQAILYYIKQIYPDVVNLDRTALNGIELDIYIPSLSVAIEYDGLYYHKEPKRVEFDKTKNQLCSEKHILLIRIRENGLPLMAETNYLKVITMDVFTHSLESKTNLEKVLNQLLSLLGVVCDVNIERDEMLIRSNYMKESGEDTLALLFPNLVQEWHPTKNGTLSPNDVKANSGLKVWWKCKEGHEWKAIINSRTRENSTGCPYCSGHRFLKGKNDLLTCFPEIAKEWHPTKNGELTPSDVTKSYNKKVWWLGKCGHEWEATVNNRTGHSKTKCPYCSNQKLLKGYNDLKTTFPSIAEEWHPSLNGEIKPDDVMGGTVKKFWWICHNGHSYQASPHNRTNGKTGCPVCARMNTGVNDLQTCFPEIAAEWHPTLNVNLTPNRIAKSCNKKVWWKCAECGHEWDAIVNSRTGKSKSGCPICSRERRKKKLKQS